MLKPAPAELRGGTVLDHELHGQHLPYEMDKIHKLYAVELPDRAHHGYNATTQEQQTRDPSELVAGDIHHQNWEMADTTYDNSSQTAQQTYAVSSADILNGADLVFHCYQDSDSYQRVAPDAGPQMSVIEQCQIDKEAVHGVNNTTSGGSDRG
jgi:hypothetical protein